MGCNSSKANQLAKFQIYEQAAIKKPEYQNIEHMKDFYLSPGDMVGEKQGKISKDYTIMNPPLSKSAYGEVRKAIHKQTQMLKTIKIISKSHTPKLEQERLKNEIEILKQLDHPNIIRIFEFYQDTRFYYIVTEFCSGGELFDKILEEKFIDEVRAADIMTQILSAVNYCHQNNIVHRDLKPENILLQSNSSDSLIKIVDFGTSIAYDPTQKLSLRVGTPYYIAPEVLEKCYDSKCDIWSCGVILYIMLCGYPPFNGHNDANIMEKVKSGKFEFESEEWASVSDNAKTLIRRMLEKDPKKRISANDALKDSWILQNRQNKQNVEAPTLQRTLKNMRNFKAEKKLQQAVLIFFVNHLASDEEKDDLLKVFQALDTNGDGKLSKKEIMDGYAKISQSPYQEQLSEDDINRIIQIVDKNNSGFIDYTEWVVAAINREQLISKERLELAFKMFDKDGSGTLSIDEVKDLFGSQNYISEKVWREILTEVDENGDGQIQFKEFRSMMLKLIDMQRNDNDFYVEYKENAK